MFKVQYKGSVTERGFTLIELLVAVFVFLIVAFVAVGSLVSLSGALRRASATKQVYENLAITLDSMSFIMRERSADTKFYCDDGSGSPDIVNPSSCTSLAGARRVIFQRAAPSGLMFYGYYYDSTALSIRYRSGPTLGDVSSVSAYTPLTDQNIVQITDARFYVDNNPASQRVTIYMRAQPLVNPMPSNSVTIQTSVTSNKWLAAGATNGGDRSQFDELP